MSRKAKKPKIAFTLDNIVAGAQELAYARDQLKHAVVTLTVASDSIRRLPVSKQLDVLSSMDSRHVSLYLVTVLSLQGVDTLRMANGLVPEELTDGRIGIMSRIVKQHCNLMDLIEEECQVAHKISMQKLCLLSHNLGIVQYCLRFNVQKVTRGKTYP